jgi:wobble nucleotide-excising tRNase
MIEELAVANVATYAPEGQRLPGLRRVNFVYGPNGSGKTTLSRLIADPTAAPDCRVIWNGGRPLEALVFNSDYVERTFQPRMRGIFTLGSQEGELLNQIEQLRLRIGGLSSDRQQLQATLSGSDGTGGKEGERSTLKSDFVQRCWELKTAHEEDFSAAFEGLRNSKAKFCDRVIEEAAGNSVDLVDLETLMERAKTVYREGVTRLEPLGALEGDELLALGQDPVLGKRVIGREDIDLGALIRRLGNSDWVRHGLDYIGGAGEPCPMCQKPVDEKLLHDLRAFFDEAYAADIAAIDRVREGYRHHAEQVAARAADLLASGSEMIDQDRMRSMVGRLQSTLELNIRHLDRKRREPSLVVTMESLQEALTDIDLVLAQANAEIGEHNRLVENLTEEKVLLTRQIWRRLIEDNKGPITTYTAASSNLDRAVEGLTHGLARKDEEIGASRAGLAELERAVTSVQPVVDEINATLASFGFTSFSLRSTGEEEQFYEIVRQDGSNAQRTLSEGERSFITFLYFFHSIRGSHEATGVNADRVVVFDDPVSSLDSDVLFIVGSLIKSLLGEARDGTGQVKQVFVLTHNIYFHKEVTFDRHRSAGAAMAYETFWVVRKSQGTSLVDRREENPVRTSYELLWAELRQPVRSTLTVQNVMRRILEHYFKILGDRNFDDIVAQFEGQDRQICASLFSWVNEGSHTFADDLYFAVDESLVDRYLTVFRRVFEVANHDAHYRMMMRIEEEEEEALVQDVAE